MPVEYEILERELKILSQNLQADLKQFLRDRGHEGEGILDNSIRITFKKDVNGYNLQLEALKYIQYLEHGQFIKDWYAKNMNLIKDTISKYAIKDIVEDIKQLPNENIYP